MHAEKALVCSLLFRGSIIRGFTVELFRVMSSPSILRIQRQTARVPMLEGILISTITEKKDVVSSILSFDIKLTTSKCLKNQYYNI